MHKGCIVLIGMSGCGKSTLGKMLAQKRNCVFIDTDELIVKKYGPIEELFQLGEDHFRKCETEIITSLNLTKEAVVSTGGGVVTVEKNMEHLLKGFVVYLKRAIQKITDTDGRPMLKTNSLEELFERRKKLYEGYAHLVFLNDFDDIHTAAENLYEVIYETSHH